MDPKPCNCKEQGLHGKVELQMYYTVQFIC